MSTFPNSPRLLKGGIVLVGTSPTRIIGLQYNPDTLTRTLQVQGITEGGDRSEALRLKGPPIETIKLDAEMDVTDQLEFPDQNPTAAKMGLHPQIAALETLIYPTTDQLRRNNSLAGFGTLEIAPMESFLTLFVWSKNRIVPVRITDMSITEEAFDPALNPIRAKISLSMRVLSVTDLGFGSNGNLYLAYQKNKEQLASLSPGATFGALGIDKIS